MPSIPFLVPLRKGSITQLPELQGTSNPPPPPPDPVIVYYYYYYYDAQSTLRDGDITIVCAAAFCHAGRGRATTRLSITHSGASLGTSVTDKGVSVSIYMARTL